MSQLITLLFSLWRTFIVEQWIINVASSPKKQITLNVFMTEIESAQKEQRECKNLYYFWENDICCKNCQMDIPAYSYVAKKLWKGIYDDSVSTTSFCSFTFLWRSENFDEYLGICNSWTSRIFFRTQKLSLLIEITPFPLNPHAISPLPPYPTTPSPS